MSDIRYPIFENSKVKVWRSVISKAHPLTMHRHDKSRVVIPLTNVKAKQVFEDIRKAKAAVWKLGQAYWFDPDPPGELHGYVNDSGKKIEVIVIELKQN